MTEEQRPLQIGVVGLGLIGGSFAAGLKASGMASWVTAWDTAPAMLAEGVALGVIDAPAESLEALMSLVDVAVLAVPGVACEALLPQMLALASGDCCVTDVASVKGPLARLAASLPAEMAARFVPGHPIAGSERSGVAAARADLFRDHRVILTPLANTDAVALGRVERLWESLGAEVTRMSPREHDAVLASTSHLPHMLAYALVDAVAQAPTRDDIFRYAAGGFRDFTRIASSNPVMWRDIALANREALLDGIDGFSAQLELLRSAIDGADGPALEQLFLRAKTARDDYLAARGETAAVAGPAGPKGSS